MTDTLTETAVHRIRYEQDPSDPFRATVELDGVDISSDVVAVHISARAHDVPDVVLELSKSAKPVRFEGLARVAVGEEHDPGPAAAAFLAAIDAETLEAAALSHPDLENSPCAVTKMMLHLLQEWASGRS